MGSGHQKQLRKGSEGHTDRNMVLRTIAKLGNDQSFCILLTGTAGGRKEEIGLLGGHQLTDTGEALAVRSGLAILAKLLCRGAAQPFLNGFAVASLLLLLQDIAQLAAGQLPAQFQKLRDGDVDVDVIGLPLPCRFVQIVGGKDEMGSAVAEGIGKALHEAVSSILADDLARIFLTRHFSSPSSVGGCHPAVPAFP